MSNTAHQKYTIETLGGYYYLFNNETGRSTNTGYDCGDHPRKENGDLPDIITYRYRRALSLTFTF